MLLENGRRVHDWIEADADEMHPLLEPRVLLQLRLDRREMTVHQGTKCRHRALRVDEGHENGRSLEGAEATPPAVLIDEPRVGNRFARLQQLESGGSRWCGSV